LVRSRIIASDPTTDSKSAKHLLDEPNVRKVGFSDT
jgi:hypothetical protein